jgi:hypothetical protein
MSNNWYAVQEKLQLKLIWFRNREIIHKDSRSLPFLRNGLEQELGDGSKRIKERELALNILKLKDYSQRSWSDTPLKTEWCRNWIWRKGKRHHHWWVVAYMVVSSRLMNQRNEFYSLKMRVSLSKNWTSSSSSRKMVTFKVLEFKWNLCIWFLYAEVFWKCMIALDV